VTWTIVRGVAALLLNSSLYGYSVLSHEAIVDTVWDSHLRPAILKRFPQAQPQDLKQAHASAYAGCIIQDLGYYPFGNQLFSDLVHYVRSGDFVVNMLKEARTIQEFGFALGALAHYAADTRGHSIAVNRSVPLQYPRLERKFGPEVTYADNKTSHVRVEFSFDVLQVAHGSYAPQAYHDFIGFEVPAEVLQRAFYDTYGLKLEDVFSDLDLALGTYRRAVSTLIPEMTRVAWNIKKDELQKAKPSVTRNLFVYNLSRASYRKEWKTNYRAPGVGTRILTFFIRILPKVGPLQALRFKPPTTETEKLFETSFNRTVADYRTLLTEQADGRLKLDNRDLDTGKPTQACEYSLADLTYAKLARELAAKNSANNAAVQDVLAFFKDLNQPFAVKKNSREWHETVSAIEKLRSTQASAKTE
jgi:hypothetical protein